MLPKLSAKWFGGPSGQSSRRDYSPLLKETASEDGLDSPNGKGHQNEASATKSLPSPIFISNITFTLLNLALAIYARVYFTSFPPSSSFYPIHWITHDDFERLKRPSQFINLENMYATTQPSVRTFKNWPLLLAPLDPNNPHTALGNDPKRSMTPIGVISPEDREFHVSETITTIAQFRPVDYLMEFCQLVIKPPPDTVSGTSSIEIYQLDLTQPLKARDLTFSNRPTCNSQRISGAQVFNGSHFQHNFHCPQNQLVSFQVRCEQGTVCNLNWWQNKEHHHDNGIFVLQSSVAFT